MTFRSVDQYFAFSFNFCKRFSISNIYQYSMHFMFYCNQWNWPTIFEFQSQAKINFPAPRYSFGLCLKQSAVFSTVLRRRLSLMWISCFNLVRLLYVLKLFTQNKWTLSFLLHSSCFCEFM